MMRRKLVAIALFVPLLTSSAWGHPFLRGDVIPDGKLGLADAIMALRVIFIPGTVAECPDSIDFDDSGKVNLADVIAILVFIFVPGSTPPAPPWPVPGGDPTPDILPCGEGFSTDRDFILADGQQVFLKGVDYSPHTGGDVPGGPITKVDMAQDLQEIKEVLGANAVRIYNPLPKEFYDAARENGLYVIQGIWLNPNPPGGFFAYLDEAKTTIRGAIDTIHAHGASDVVIAYVLGSGFDTVAMANTIRNESARPRYQGTYYSTPAETDLPRANFYPGCPTNEQVCSPDFNPPFPDPHPMQSYLAALADDAATYENDTYQVRHLMGHATRPQSSAFLDARDRPAPAIDLPIDLSFFDIVLENIYTYDLPYVAYLGFADYIKNLKAHYHSTPVIVLETGYSTSPTTPIVPEPACGFPPDPVATTFSYGGVSPEDQALGIATRWAEVRTASRPLAGFFVYEYYDNWWVGGNQWGRDDDQQLEHFGLMSVSGTAENLIIEKRPAFDVVAGLFTCDDPYADPGTCGVVVTSPRRLKGTYDVELARSFAAVGGETPYSWELDTEGGDELPLGLSLDDSTGRISGTPMRMGTFNLRVKVTDSSAPPQEREAAVALRIGPPEFTTDDDHILMNGKAVLWKGLDYSPFIIGDRPFTEYCCDEPPGEPCGDLRVLAGGAITKADMAADLKEIKEVLNANAVRVYQPLPKAFYDEARKNGLFVFQGFHIQVDDPYFNPCSDECLNPSTDLLDPATLDEIKEGLRNAVDDVHAAGGSDVVVAYSIGNEINICVINRTIREHQDYPRYKGTYYRVPNQTPLPPTVMYPHCDCPPGFDRCAIVDPQNPPCQEPYPLDPHPFLSFIAEAADDVAIYETQRYGVRHLEGYATAPVVTAALGDEDRWQAVFHPALDMSHLDVIFENIYSYFPPALKYRGYRDYIVKWKSWYRKTPLLVLECGYSISPAGAFFTEAQCGLRELGPIDEMLQFGGVSWEEQASALQARWGDVTQPIQPGEDAEIAGRNPVAGFFVFEYMMEWWKGATSELCQQESPWVQDFCHPEEWFGIKAVQQELPPDPPPYITITYGDPPEEAFIFNLPAFDAVAEMFAEPVPGFDE